MTERIARPHISRAGYVVMAAVVLYVSVFIGISILKLELHRYNAIDLAIYQQTLWQSAHGTLFGLSIHPSSYLGDHFEPLLLMLAPFTAISSSLVIPLAAQTIMLGLGAWPIFRIARKPLGERLAALVAILYLAHPFVQNANTFEFHLLPFAIPLLLWTVCFYYEKKFPFFLVFLIGSLAVREDVALAIIPFSIVAALERRSWRWKVVPAALGIMWFVGALQIISHANPDGVYKFFSYYPLNAGSLWDIGSALISRFVSFETVLLFVALFVPFLAIPLVRPRMLIPALLVFFQLALTGFTELALKTHYVSLLIPFLFVAVIESLAAIRQHPPKWITGIPGFVKFVPVLLAIVTFYSMITFGPIPSAVSAAMHNKGATAEIRGLEKMESEIGPSESVVASFASLPDLASRKHLYALHYAFLGTRQYSDAPYEIPEDIDAVLMDARDFMTYHLQSQSLSSYDRAAESGPGRIRSLLASRGLVPVDIYDTFVLYRQKSSGLDLVRFSDTVPGDIGGSNEYLGGNVSLAGWKVGEQENFTLPVTLVWKAEGKIPTNYFFLLKMLDNEGRIVSENYYPPAYGLYPTVEWQSGQYIETSWKFAIPSNSTIRHIQVQLVDVHGYMTLDGLRSAVPHLTEKKLIGNPVELQ